MPRNITIRITGRSIALLLAALGAVWLASTFDKILLILFLATLLAIAISPLVNRLERRWVPRALAIVLIYLLLLAVLVAVAGLLVPALVGEFDQLSANLPSITRSVLDFPSAWLAPRFPMLKPLLSGNLTQQIGTQLGALAGGAGGLLYSFGKTLTTIAISLFLVLVVGFFLTADARFALRVIARFFPPRARPTVAALASEIGARLGHWVRAQILVGLFFGVAFGLGVGLMGVPYALSLGVAGAVLELIPYVGGAIVTVLAMLLAFTISPWLSLGVLIWEIVLANVESHIVYPKLVGDIVGLHPLTIIVALFIGAEARGVMGALLAVPVAVVLQVLFDRFYRFEEQAAVDDAAHEEAARVAPTPQALPPSPRIAPR